MKQKVYVLIGDSYEGVGDSESWLEGVFFSEEKANAIRNELTENWEKRKLEQNIPGYKSVYYFVTESEIQ